MCLTVRVHTCTREMIHMCRNTSRKLDKSPSAAVSSRSLLHGGPSEHLHPSLLALSDLHFLHRGGESAGDKNET